MVIGRITRIKSFCLTVMLAILLLAGCATVGKNFSQTEVRQIEIGKTSKEEVRSLFGSPWRTGLEDGLETWTYGYYKYNILKRTASTDLVVRFKKPGVVASYSFSTTDKE